MQLFILQPGFGNEKPVKLSSKLECHYCQGKDPNQLVKMGEGNIKCMRCCNFRD